MTAVDPKIITSIGKLRDTAMRVTAYYEGVRATYRKLNAEPDFVEPYGVAELRQALQGVDEALTILTRHQ